MTGTQISRFLVPAAIGLASAGAATGLALASNDAGDKHNLLSITAVGLGIVGLGATMGAIYGGVTSARAGMELGQSMSHMAKNAGLGALALPSSMAMIVMISQ